MDIFPDSKNPTKVPLKNSAGKLPSFATGMMEDSGNKCQSKSDFDKYTDLNAWLSRRPYCHFPFHSGPPEPGHLSRQFFQNKFRNQMKD